MRHRLANKSLSRPTAHRVLMLRNLVSSLLEHERISTTVAKAKEARKLADKVIAWGKRGGKDNWDRANSFLLNPAKTLRPLFSTYAERYADRPGGFTRIVRAGHRKGDHAPLAVLELVDSDHDLKYDVTARAVGRELAIKARGDDPSVWWEFRKSVEGGDEVEVLERLGESDELEPLTRKNVVKVLRYRLSTSVPSTSSLNSTTSERKEDVERWQDREADDDESDVGLVVVSPSTTFLNLAHDYYLRTLALNKLSTVATPDPTRPYKQLSQRLTPSVDKGVPQLVVTVPTAGRRHKAGERTDGWADASSSLPILVRGQVVRSGGQRAVEVEKAEDHLPALEGEAPHLVELP